MAKKRNNKPADDGEMGQLIRNKNWSDTPLGPRKEWPVELRTAINIMLTTNHPMLIFWGPELRCLYNDAYSATLGPEKHPEKLGEPGAEFFKETWNVPGPQIKGVMDGEGATWYKNELLPIYRRGKLENIYWTYSYSPITTKGGDEINGVLVICTETTEAVKAERNLRESEERLQIALETGKLGSWQLELSDYNLTASATSKSNLGLTSDAELTYRQLKSMIHSDDIKKWDESIRKAVKVNYELELEVRIFWPNGEEHWILVRGEPFYSSVGTPLRLIGVTQNITGRKRNEQLLVEQEKLMELIASGAPQEECLSSLCSAVPKFSPGVRASILLVDNENKTFYRTIAPDLLTSFRKEMEKLPANKKGVSTCSDAVYTGKPATNSDITNNGRWSKEWREVCLANDVLASHSTPVPGKDGKILGSFMLCFSEPREPNEWEKRLSEFGIHIAGIALEWEKSKKALRENEERMRLILDSAREYAIITFDQKGYITSWNEGATRLLGYEEAEIIGENGKIFFTPQDQKKKEPEKELQQAKKAGRAENERWHMRKDGSRFWGSGVMLPMANSHTRGFVKIFRDSTEQRRAEKALQESEHKYRSLFNSIDKGFCILEKINTPSGEPSNYKFIEVNPAFKRHTGISDIRYKTVLDALPEMDHSWIEIYDEVIKTGEPIHTEKYLKKTERTLEIHVSQTGEPGQQRVAILFIDITDRKSTEFFLRKNEERAIFFTTLNDAFRPLLNPVAIQDEAIQYLEKNEGYEDAKEPNLILLDINLPKMNGHKVLKHVKNHPGLKHIPVIMLTTSSDETDILKSYKNHSNCYITKPVDINNFLEVISTIEDFWISIVQLPSKIKN